MDLKLKEKNYKSILELINHYVRRKSNVGDTLPTKDALFALEMSYGAATNDIIDKIGKLEWKNNNKAIENKIEHNIKVAKDILDNTLPYYVINDNIEPLVRTTDKSLKRDLNNFNYFTNKEDVDEAIRRVKETLMNFQEEIQNRDK